MTNPRTGEAEPTMQSEEPGPDPAAVGCPHGPNAPVAHSDIDTPLPNCARKEVVMVGPFGLLIAIAELLGALFMLFIAIGLAILHPVPAALRVLDDLPRCHTFPASPRS